MTTNLSDKPGSEFGPTRGIQPPTPNVKQVCPVCNGKGARWNAYLQQFEPCDWCDETGFVTNKDGTINTDLPKTGAE